MNIISIRRLLAVLSSCAALLITPSAALAADPLRVGVLKFGTVNWELDVIEHHALAGEDGFERLPLASTRATTVALQGGAADVIVSDWIWVARQRAEGRSYTFVPYSKLVGGIVVREDSGIASLGDLRGRKLGVAGGPVDKSWLLLRALGGQELGADLAETTSPSYGAPPLLNELITRGELPAVLNYWHFLARLEAAGMKRLISTSDALRALGVEEEVPLLGWVFDESLASSRPDDLKRLFAASAQAKRMMVESDDDWQRLRKRMKAPDDATFDALRSAWRAGVPGEFTEAKRAAAAKVFAILAEQGGKELAGSATELPEGTFFSGF